MANFNSEILLLFKAVLRKLDNKYPDIVRFYIQQYSDIYGNDSREEVYYGTFSVETR